jgi:hypothetical protein
MRVFLRLETLMARGIPKGGKLAQTLPSLNVDIPTKMTRVSSGHNREMLGVLCSLHHYPGLGSNICNWDWNAASK